MSDVGRIEKTVFISYRRTNAPWAMLIFQHLTHHGYDVFFDFVGIASGDFERVILAHIKARAHFLALLTPSALEKCDQPGDWLRREIETAIEMKRNVVPLMLDGFDFSAPGIAEQLTGPMTALKSYNALRVPVEYFDEAMERLRDKYLNVALEGVLHPVSPAVQQAARDQQAAARAEPAVQIDELSAEAYSKQALWADDPDEKVRLYTEALRLNPGDAQAWVDRGGARIMADHPGATASALEDYDTAIRLEPDNCYFFIVRGNLRLHQGDNAGALADYEAAMRLNPQHPEPYSKRAILREEQGDLTGALEDCDTAIRLTPGFSDYFYARGRVRKKKGDFRGALKDFNTCMRLHPELWSKDVLVERSRLRKLQGDLARARKDWKAAKRLDPELTGDLPPD